MVETRLLKPTLAKDLAMLARYGRSAEDERAVAEFRRLDRIG